MNLRLQPWAAESLQWMKSQGMPLEPWQLIDMIVDHHGCSQPEAWASVFQDGEKLFGTQHESWESFARFLDEHTSFNIPMIASQVTGWFGEQCESTVRRVLDDSGELQAKQAEYQRDYCQRHPERRAQTQAEYYLKNRESILAKRRERRRNK